MTPIIMPYLWPPTIGTDIAHAILPTGIGVVARSAITEPIALLANTFEARERLGA